jgi:hypothetical protein
MVLGGQLFVVIRFEELQLEQPRRQRCEHRAACTHREQQAPVEIRFGLCFAAISCLPGIRPAAGRDQTWLPAAIDKPGRDEAGHQGPGAHEMVAGDAGKAPHSRNATISITTGPTTATSVSRIPSVWSAMPALTSVHEQD